MKTAHAFILALTLALTSGAAMAQTDPVAPPQDPAVDPVTPPGNTAVDPAAPAQDSGVDPDATEQHTKRPPPHHAHARTREHAAKHRFVARKVGVPASLRAGKAAPYKPAIDQFKLADREGFKKVSDLVAFPPFYPGLGIVMVKPDTLPVGPFRCFDRAGNLVSSVYMLPLQDMNDHKTWSQVKGLPLPIDHATAYFHPGHAGVPMPHYHLVLWHTKHEEAVAK